jgi:hypothetical protein
LIVRVQMQILSLNVLKRQAQAATSGASSLRV